ncbi:MAG: TolC family protein [Desulfosoma sp.]|uniref:TolC family protein n=1 Tax=Desulfosoma sp. TaxID=2603217 RepID=UPI00404B86E1
MKKLCAQSHDRRKSLFLRKLPGFLAALWMTAAGFWPLNGVAWALTLEDALRDALATHPEVKAAEQDLQARRALERSSLSPYAPSVDLLGSLDYISKGGLEDRRDQASLGAEYLLFDGGARFSERSAATMQRAQAEEALRAARLNVVRDVSEAFFLVLARSRIVAERTLQVEDARKDLEIAQGRYRLGVAMKSDVLQASVRYEESLYEKNSAEGELSTARATLWSLVGRPLEETEEIEGTLEYGGVLQDREVLLRMTETQRPEVRLAQWAVALAAAQERKTLSPFLPRLTADAGYTSYGGTGAYAKLNDEKRVGLTASWNLFRLSKYYDRKAASAQLRAAQDRLSEAQRLGRLECHSRYDRALTARRNVDLARSVLVQAEHNYRQALGEYRVGKGDVLSLVRAESALGAARVRLQEALGNWNVSLVNLQRAVGLERLDELMNAE